MRNKIKILISLLIGLGFFYFTNGTHFFAIAAWLYPLFILHVTRKGNKLMNYLIVPLLLAITLLLSLWEYMFGNPSHLIFYAPSFLGIIIGYIFVLDQFIYTRIKGFAATLAFPIIYTSFEFLVSLLSPLGSGGILPYTQLDFLPFAQLASLTGLWGMTFMITWFASIVNWAYHRKHTRSQIFKGIGIYFAILATILIYGGLRLSFDNIHSTVKISGIHTIDRPTSFTFDKALAKKDFESAKKLSRQTFKDLKKATVQEATVGSKIIHWSETAFMVLKEEEAYYNRKFSQLADSLNIYLVVNPYVGNVGTLDENKLRIFSPEGKTLLEHYKFGGSMFETSIKGDEIIKGVKTDYGIIAGIVCWDADFPSIVRQISHQDVDILFVPASNKRGITPMHSIISVFRGIENGCSVVRQSQNGLSFITDNRGRFITQMNHFHTNEWVMSGYTPNKSVKTLYSIIGDLFGWLALLFLLIFAGIAMKKKKYTY